MSKNRRIEKIKNVTLDLTFYKGTDTYSDGDVEEELLAIARSGEDLEEILVNSKDWALLYHFSPVRKNILEWYDFDKKKTALEIGAGCGAITGLLCEKCKEVTAIDLSKRRSSINAYRNGQYDNLTIKVGNFEDIDLDGETFDYITLIGVLEYSIYYLSGENPFLGMLKRVKSMLKPGGVLFVAIENKYGLKYFAGAKEDHNGVAFEGIENYPTAENVRTFSKKALEKLTDEAGFTATFYYPYPDYKMPTMIFSDEYLPSTSDLDMFSKAYDRERFSFFDEKKAFKGIIEDGYFPDFSNSFLLELR